MNVLKYLLHMLIVLHCCTVGKDHQMPRCIFPPPTHSLSISSVYTENLNVTGTFSFYGQKLKIEFAFIFCSQKLKIAILNSIFIFYIAE